jgi:hypothetical protein
MRKLQYYFLAIPPEDVGAPITPVRPQEVVFTDASLEGWGGYMQHHYLADIWHAPLHMEHISRLELRAVHLTLELLASKLANKAVRLFCDN